MFFTKMFSRNYCQCILLVCPTKMNSMIRFSSASSSSSSSNSSGGDSARPYYKATQPMAWDELFAKEMDKKMTKENFLKLIEAFRVSRGKRGGGQVEFIDAARKHLELYGLHKDLDVYKALLRVFPEGELIPKNMFQRAFWWYPQHQVCAINLLEEMEWNGLLSDKELFDIMVSRFGKWNYCTKKVHRQLYWQPKLKHMNKYLDRRLVENKQLLDVELARIALRMICRDAGTQITSFKAPFVDAPDKFNWIASAQSPLQKKLIADLPQGSTCNVDGPFRVWVREHKMHYIMLSSQPMVEEDEEFRDMRQSHLLETPEEFHEKLWEPNLDKFNVHQQADGTILALAILGTHSHDYASAWISHLHEENRRLSNFSILFRLKEIQKNVFKFQRDASGAR